MQDVRTTRQHVRTLPSIPEYFRFPLRTRKGVTVKTSRPDVVLSWEDLIYSRKAVAEDRSNEANFRPYTPQPESEFE
jgi:hypothetical protein